MTSRHKKVPLEEALAGMVLSEDIRDARGGILIAKATVLSDTTLTSLRRRGVEHLYVMDDSWSEQAWATESEQIRSRLAGLFRKCHGNRACDQLRQQVLEYRLGESG